MKIILINFDVVQLLKTLIKLDADNKKVKLLLIYLKYRLSQILGETLSYIRDTLQITKEISDKI